MSDIERMKAAGDVEGLIKALEEGTRSLARNLDVNVRTACIQAAKALGELGDAQAVPPLIRVLRSSYEEGIRGMAAEALGKLGDARAVGPLMEYYRGEYDSGNRKRAIYALQKLTDESAIEFFVSALNDDRRDASGSRAAAAEVLAESGDPRAVQGLIDALQTVEDPYLRATVAELLGSMGKAEAVSALRKSAQKDESQRVREKASQALERLREEGVQPTKKRWQFWQ